MWIGLWTDPGPCPVDDAPHTACTSPDYHGTRAAVTVAVRRPRAMAATIAVLAPGDVPPDPVAPDTVTPAPDAPHPDAATFTTASYRRSVHGRQRRGRTR